MSNHVHHKNIYIIKKHVYNNTMKYRSKLILQMMLNYIIGVNHCVQKKSDCV